jgi:ribose transport system substrate-binding protein
MTGAQATSDGGNNGTSDIPEPDGDRHRRGGHGGARPAARAQDKQTFTLALVPGLTTDAFYITMRRGAEAAAAALGDELVFQGASEWNVTLQVPVLDAVIARQPDAILIAPTDKVQLVAPLKKAADAGIP